MEEDLILQYGSASLMSAMGKFITHPAVIGIIIVVVVALVVMWLIDKKKKGSN